MLSRLRSPTLRSPGQGLPLILMNGRLRLLMLRLRLRPLRMKAATTALRSSQDEAIEQLDIVKRENKNLADEIKDLLDQL